MKHTILNAKVLANFACTALLGSATFAYASSTVTADTTQTKQVTQEFGQMTPTTVSETTWRAISNWSTDSLSLLEFIADNDEEYQLNRYIDLLVRDHRDAEVLAQVQALDKNVLDLWSQAMAEASPEDNYLFTRYLAQYKPALFDQWLASNRALTLPEFLNQQSPQLYDTWYSEHAAPKRKGLSVLEYDKTLSGEVYAELKDLLNKLPVGGSRSQCACQMITPQTGSGHVVTNYPATPSNWSDYSSDNSGLSKHKLDFKTTAYGAFHSGDGERWSKHKVYGYDSSINHNSSEFYVKMLCADTNGYDCNQSNSCSGNLEVRGTYAARFNVTGQAKKIWSKATNSHSGDGAKFAVDLPGGAPEVVLFNKAGGAAMSYNTGWDINSVLGALKAALGITAAIVSDNPGSLLDGQLASDLITNIAGMITRSGNEATVNSTMRARFDSSDVSPFLLQPNEVYHFTLDSNARVKARGYGGYSDSHFEYGSSGAIMYAANQFTCGSNVTPPMPTGLWFYADQSGPDSVASLRSDVETWLSMQLNKPVSAAQPQGIVH
ncbi:hypothetical protein [Pseudoalteromonas byunsanensis]|uniref:Uncharacterized protein n=1 Tax=Pseudoalteromonas byunsanensis TaxID=327939 RepID=A0A1S1N5E5_9GAMM|nr:hypothetical protein [Pseudoalteromonas byunsanensis]OHU94536.1 hypothetical protein BIW53_15860 [Pseudoalteromonas byunsanensis]